jgi:hypothetical protein
VTARVVKDNITEESFPDDDFDDAGRKIDENEES